MKTESKPKSKRKIRLVGPVKKGKPIRRSLLENERQQILNKRENSQSLPFYDSDTDSDTEASVAEKDSFIVLV